MPNNDRREQILQALARMLQDRPGQKITTASLAQQVGVSEAALYRHFPSKGKMLEGLIVFTEETLFTRIHKIFNDYIDAPSRCQHILHLILAFVETNPGFARLFVGDALQGETERLRERMHQLLNRVETQLRQILREYNATQPFARTLQINSSANLMMAVIEGRISQFVRSNFSLPPTQDWEGQWQMLEQAVFDSAAPATQ